MAYQSVGTPRFLVNVLEWLDSNGAAQIDTIFRTIPVNTVYSGTTDELNWVPPTADISGYEIPSGILGSKSFVAVLGHTFPQTGSGFGIYDGEGNAYDAEATDDIVINDGGGLTPLYSGFTIRSCEGFRSHAGIYWRFAQAGSLNIGSFIIGTYYDMPHSPDLSLTMTREYGGTKTIETKGGASLSNTFYTKQPSWGAHPAWELWDETTNTYHGNEGLLSLSGRRQWDLSFSYLQDSDIFPELSSIGWVEAGYSDTDDLSGKTLLDADSFFSQVVHRTNGGQLPFIFQPDSSNNNQFAICKFDMNEFSFEQVANGVYNIKLKIREVW